MTRMGSVNALLAATLLWLIEIAIYFAMFVLLQAGPMTWALEGAWLGNTEAVLAKALLLTVIAETIVVLSSLDRSQSSVEVWTARVEVAAAGFVCLTAAGLLAGIPSIDQARPLGRLLLANTHLAALWGLGLLALRLGHVRAAQLGLLARRVVVVGRGADAARTVAAINGLPHGLFRVEAAAGLDVGHRLPLVSRPRPWGVVLTEGRSAETPPLAGLARGVKVIDNADFWEAQLGRIEPATAQGRIVAPPPQSRSIVEALHRTLDIVLAALLLLLMAPLMLLTALAIRIDSAGPVIYRQERVGRYGVPFTLLKFRSMRLDSELGGPVWAAERDTRITRVGRLIRMMRIDELPQLLNVLGGAMSLVGPRPERPHFVETLAREIPLYRARARVKPGLTGWAQVNHPYGASIEDARVKHSYDLYYVKHRSLMFDLAILFATVRVVLFQQGAR